MNRPFCFASLAMGIGAGVLLAACGPESREENRGEAALAASQAPGSEIEPNDVPGLATPIGTDTVVRANIFPNSADTDYFAFQGGGTEKVFAATMTAFSPSGGD